jgi:hypothetical protein
MKADRKDILRIINAMLREAKFDMKTWDILNELKFRIKVRDKRKWKK